MEAPTKNPVKRVISAIKTMFYGDREAGDTMRRSYGSAQPNILQDEDDELATLLQNPTEAFRMVREALEYAFGARLTPHFAVGLLLPRARTSRGFTTMSALFTLLGRHHAPCDEDFLLAWSGLITHQRQLGVLDQLIGLVQPVGQQEWQSLLAVHEQYNKRLAASHVAPALAGLPNVICSMPTLRLLLDALDSPIAGDALLAALAPFQTPPGSWDEFLPLLLPHARTPELAARVAEIGVTLARRDRTGYGAQELAELFKALPDRLAVKRYLRVLEILDGHGIGVNEFDPFVTSFASTNERVRWLDEAAALGDWGRPVSRLSLVQMLDWAPDLDALARYTRGVRALSGTGLDEDAVDRFLRPRLANEQQALIAAMIGKAGGKLFQGKLTLARAEELFNFLTERAMVIRLDRTMALLAEAGLSQPDIEALALSFAIAEDGLRWLEAFCRHTQGLDHAVDRVELLKLREQCPEVEQLVRYFRVRAAFDSFPRVPKQVIEALAHEAIESDGRQAALVALASTLADCGRHHECSAITIWKLNQALQTRAEVERYRTAISNLQGSWDRIDDLVLRLATTDERAAVIQMVGRNLASRKQNVLDESNTGETIDMLLTALFGDSDARANLPAGYASEVQRLLQARGSGSLANGLPAGLTVRVKAIEPSGMESHLSAT